MIEIPKGTKINDLKIEEGSIFSQIVHFSNFRILSSQFILANPQSKLFIVSRIF